MILMFWEFSVMVFLAGLVAGEFYLLLLRNRPLWLRIAYFVLLAAGWTIVYYLVEPPTANRTAYPHTFFRYLVFAHTTPVVLLAVGLECASTLTSRYAPHVGLAIVALVIGLFWPSFIVYLHCGMLECF